jgi:hypothetical protein
MLNFQKMSCIGKKDAQHFEWEILQEDILGDQQLVGCPI